MTAQYRLRPYGMDYDCWVTLRLFGHFVTAGSQFNHHGNSAAPVERLFKCKNSVPHAPVVNQVQKLSGGLAPLYQWSIKSVK